MVTASHILAPRLGEGVYTLPDAAHILGLPLTRLRGWVGSYFDTADPHSEQLLATWGRGRSRGFSFLVLIEAYTIYNLRRLGVSLQRIRVAREVLEKHLGTPHPFASRGILASGGRVLFELQDSSPSAVLHLSPGKQTEFRDVIAPFCTRLDFDSVSKLAERFWPCGKDVPIVVDPRRSFGRPTIAGTNITVEAIADLVDAGEAPNDVAAQYDVALSAVEDACRFTHPFAAWGSTSMRTSRQSLLTDSESFSKGDRAKTSKSFILRTNLAVGRRMKNGCPPLRNVTDAS